MNTHREGGRAFPLPSEPGELAAEPGMTLRDYFAAQALPTAIKAAREFTKVELNGATRSECAASLAYQMADAMLAERSK